MKNVPIKDALFDCYAQIAFEQDVAIESLVEQALLNAAGYEGMPLADDKVFGAAVKGQDCQAGDGLTKENG